MYFLAACDDSGRCFGFLRKDGSVSKNPDAEPDKLKSYEKKAYADEKAMQINLGHALLPDGSPFRVAVVKN
jgi:hypothetical protein